MAKNRTDIVVHLNESLSDGFSSCGPFYTLSLDVSSAEGVYPNPPECLLRFSCQADPDKPQGYGFHLSFTKYGWEVNLSDAEGYVKVLRRITRKMQATADRYGSPDSFGTACLHFLDAIGAGSVVNRIPESVSEGCTIAAADATHRVYHSLATWQKRHGLKSDEE